MPQPYPIASTIPSGISPYSSAKVATIAAPVGVTISFFTPVEYTGTLASLNISNVAGAGTGITPC